MLMMALHELSHNLGFAAMRHNRWFAVVANISIALPAAVTFKRYHMDHHKYQGVDGIDVDIPTAAEGRLFHTTFTKFWLSSFKWHFTPCVRELSTRNHPV
jgi:sphingolipid 4-desaturase/C4-monooxygenase